jgi:hypothetical protein
MTKQDKIYFNNNFYGTIFLEDGSIVIMRQQDEIYFNNNCYGTIFKEDGSIAIII